MPPEEDFVGDPPREERCLYPVSDGDAGTLPLIRAAAQRLHALAPRRTTQ